MIRCGANLVASDAVTNFGFLGDGIIAEIVAEFFVKPVLIIQWHSIFILTGKDP